MRQVKEKVMQGVAESIIWLFYNVYLIVLGRLIYAWPSLRELYFLLSPVWCDNS